MHHSLPREANESYPWKAPDGLDDLPANVRRLLPSLPRYLSSTLVFCCQVCHLQLVWVWKLRSNYTKERTRGSTTRRRTHRKPWRRPNRITSAHSDEMISPRERKERQKERGRVQAQGSVQKESGRRTPSHPTPTQHVFSVCTC